MADKGYTVAEESCRQLQYNIMLKLWNISMLAHFLQILLQQRLAQFVPRLHASDIQVPSTVMLMANFTVFASLELKETRRER